MTLTRFHTIAKCTADTFWPAVYKHVSPEEATFLRSTPLANRNLQRRLVLALAHTLLGPEQIAKIKDTDLEPTQSNLPDTSTQDPEDLIT